MDNEVKVWLEYPRFSEGYLDGVKKFIAKAFDKFPHVDQLRCPCEKCMNLKWHSRESIYDHLVCHGHDPLFAQWIYQVTMENEVEDVHEKDCDMGMGFGDDLGTMLHDALGNLHNGSETNEDGLRKGPNLDARKFYKLVEEGKQPLYPRCEKFSTLSFTVRLYLLKCMHGVSEAAFSDFLELIRDAFPNANVPKSFNVVKNVIKDLGLDYQKVHACPNDCMLYWAENEDETTCKICGASRWKVAKEYDDRDNERPNQSHKVAAKVMRYFPLKPRLQRMFMSKGFSELMTWHARGRKKDGKLRHPADGRAWKEMDDIVASALPFAASLPSAASTRTKEVDENPHVDGYSP